MISKLRPSSIEPPDNFKELISERVLKLRSKTSPSAREIPSTPKLTPTAKLADIPSDVTMKSPFGIDTLIRPSAIFSSALVTLKLVKPSD